MCVFDISIRRSTLYSIVQIFFLCSRWRYLLTLLLVSSAFAKPAEHEDSIPDAGVDDSDELALNEEVCHRYMLS